MSLIVRENFSTSIHLHFCPWSLQIKFILFLQPRRIPPLPKSRVKFRKIRSSMYKIIFFPFAKKCLKRCRHQAHVSAQMTFIITRGVRISLRRVALQGWAGDSAYHLLIARCQQLTHLWRDSSQRAHMEEKNIANRKQDAQMGIQSSTHGGRRGRDF